MVQKLKHDAAFVANDYEVAVATVKQACFTFESGKSLKLSTEQFECTEILFKPYLLSKTSIILGVHEVLYETIMNCPLDVRGDLLCNIYLSGGNTHLTGFKERLYNEVVKLSPETRRVRIVAPPERKYMVWIGGSILASLLNFQQMWATREEYEKDGPAAVVSKFICF